MEALEGSATPAADEVTFLDGPEEPHTKAEGEAEAENDTSAVDQKMPKAQSHPEPSSAENVDETIYPSWPNRILVFLALALAVFIVGLDVTIMATAVPSIASEFNSLSDIGWYGSSYLMMACSFQLAYGKVYRLFSVKWVFITTLVVFEIGSVVTATAHSSVAVIIGRAVSGLGFGGIAAGSFSLIVHAVPLHNRPIFTGMLGVAEAAGFITGPLIGGALTTKLSWRWCFYINLPCGAFTIAIIMTFLSDSRSPDSSLTLKQKQSEFDWIGTILFVGSIMSLLLPLQWGGDTYSWSNIHVIALFVLSGVLAVLFIAVQLRQRQKSTIPIQIITQRSIAFGVAFAFFLGSAMSVISYYISLWFQSVKFESALQSGVHFLPVILGLMVSSMLAAVLITNIGYYTPFMIVGSALLAVATGLVTTFKPDTPASTWVGYLAFLGLAAGLGFQQPLLTAQVVLPKDDVPTGTSLVIFAQSLGGAIFVAVAKTVFTTRLTHEINSLSGMGSDVDPSQLTASDQDEALGSYLRQNPMPLNDSIMQTFYLPIGLAGAAFLVSWGMEWRCVKGQKKAAAAV